MSNLYLPQSAIEGRIHAPRHSLTDINSPYRLAVGLLYSLETDSTALFDSSEDFASLARRFLRDELEAPSVSTVLTLIVLCSLSAAEALDDQGRPPPCTMTIN